MCMVVYIGNKFVAEPLHSNSIENKILNSVRLTHFTIHKTPETFDGKREKWETKNNSYINGKGHEAEKNYYERLLFIKCCM